MDLKRSWRGIFLAAVFEQWGDVALVVNLNGLLGSRRVVARWRWLKDEPVDCGEYNNSSGEAEHFQGLLHMQVCAARSPCAQTEVVMYDVTQYLLSLP